MSISPEQLKQAILLARSGERERARALFQAVLAEEPENFSAWLWMSELAETLEGQTAALEKAISLLPPDSTGLGSLQNRLDALREADPPAEAAPPVRDAPRAVPIFKPSPEPAAEIKPNNGATRVSPVQQAEQAALAGNAAEAMRILSAYLEKHQDDEYAWRLMAEVEPDPEKKARALEKLLALNPRNADAAKRLKELQSTLRHPLERGQYLEESGDEAQAIQLYRSVILLSRSATERITAQRRIEAIQIRQEASAVQPINPTLNLLRVTAGPAVLFAVMVFMQSGLNLLHTPLLAVPGMALVLIGSMLVSVTTMRPMHPKWIEMFGSPGTGNEPENRRDLRLLGWGLMLLPFTIFLIEASFRLGALEASMMSAP